MLKRFQRTRELFRNWKLVFRETKTSYTFVYKKKDWIKISKTFPKSHLSIWDIQWFIIDLYYDYEYDTALSNNEIAILLWVDVHKVKHLLKKILQKTKTHSIKILL